MNQRKNKGRLAAFCTAAVLLSAAVPAMPAQAAATLTVGKNGTYKTVGEAVSAAAKLNPSSEGSRVTIAIEPGTYREQLLINTPYLTFTNSNPSGGEVLLTWYYGIGYKYYSADDNGYYSAQKAAAKSGKHIASRWGTAVRLQSGAKNFRAENITFENSFNRYMTNEELADGVEPTGETLTVQRRNGLDVKAKSATERAAALCVEADNCEFYKCQFLSSQDTLYTASRAYFKECRIQGNTDYIFGSGDVVFDACELCFGGYSDNAVGGYITAARQQTNGYLFWECNVTAAAGMKVGSGCFGRPWKDTAHVLFYNTKLQYESIISSAGWTSMSGVGPEQATFREYNTKTMNGGNVNTGGRVRGTVLSSCNATREQYLSGWTPYYMNYNGTVERKAAKIDAANAYYIRNVGSGLYLGTEGAVKDGANLVQTGKENALVWVPEAVNGYYMLYADTVEGDYFNESYYLLDVDGGSSENGANISIRKDASADLIAFYTAGDGIYELRTKVTGDKGCIAVDGDKNDAGANILQWENNGEAGQQWELEVVDRPLKGELIRTMTVLDKEHITSWALVYPVQNGIALFGDRAYQINNLPAEMSGAELIRTACDAKAVNTDLAEITAAKPVTVAVALDARVNPAPAWLSGWQQSAMTVDSSNGEHFVCYTKNLDAGEKLTLGSNGTASNCVNYVAFAIPKPEETTTTTTATTTTEITTTTTTTEETTVTTEETTAETTAVSSQTGQKTKTGDVNCSGTVDVSDAVLLARFVAEDAGAELSASGKANAECDGDGELTGNDTIRILQHIAKINLFED
ncbi:MAG: RICIN domain-containing protein [Oscillospiraceae bacterium]|nr:RICIN domain-containing protein [Oscillospiraceae bacterium]